MLVPGFYFTDAFRPYGTLVASFFCSSTNVSSLRDYIGSVMFYYRLAFRPYGTLVASFLVFYQRIIPTGLNAGWLVPERMI